MCSRYFAAQTPSKRLVPVKLSPSLPPSLLLSALAEPTLAAGVGRVGENDTRRGVRRVPPDPDVERCRVFVGTLGR